MCVCLPYSMYLFETSRSIIIEVAAVVVLLLCLFHFFLSLFLFHYEIRVLRSVLVCSSFFCLSDAIKLLVFLLLIETNTNMFEYRNTRNVKGKRRRGCVCVRKKRLKMIKSKSTMNTVELSWCMQCMCVCVVLVNMRWLSALFYCMATVFV